MLKVFTIALFVFLWLASTAQHTVWRDGTPIADKSATGMIEIYADRFDQSNALTREFYQKFGFGGYLSPDVIAGAAHSLKAENHFGGLMHPGISWYQFNSQQKYSWRAAYRHTLITRFDFSDDLFRLVMNGNSEFGTQPVNISGTDFENMRYQQLEFGIFNQLTGSFLTLGLYDGLEYQRTQIDKGNVATSYSSYNNIHFAESISVSAEGFRSYQTYGNYAPFKRGFGLGISAAYRLTTSRGVFTFRLRDLGVMRWNVNRADTSGVFNYQGTSWTPDHPDTGGSFSRLKDSLSVHREKSTLWRALPGMVSVQYIALAREKYFMSASLRYYYSMGFFPELNAALNMKYGNKNVVWVSVNGGGFNYFDVGVGTQVHLFNKYGLTIGSDNLSGLLLNNGHAESLYIQLNLKI